ncbi:MAG: hypothetical protein IT364_28020 [Candidatus Hydrogenedentes bacterium]|nr:hypothetical protein [Candidatus Hydrogenedentota bacterium]
MSSLVLATALLLSAAAEVSMPVLLPTDLVDPQGVRLEAQVPEPGMTLMEKDAERPTLWYAPVATRTAGDVVQLWYQRVNKGETEYSDQRTLCLGEIRDGQWTLPELSSEPLPWGGPNNVCLRRSPHKPTWGGFNVFQIVEAGDMLQMLYWDQPAETGEAGAMRATSRDGRVWEKLSGAVFTEHNDAYSLIYVKGEYILYQTSLEPWPDKPYPDNLDKFKRVLCIRTSEDLQTWTPQEVFLRPDAQDPPETEFYLMKVFQYGSGYAGLIMKYYADPQKPKLHSAILKYELVVSEDTRTWVRPFRDTDLGFWSYADPFMVSGKMHFAMWQDGAMVTVAYVPGRIVAAVAEGTEGSFKTKPFERPDAALALNADARNGWIEVSLLDGAGKPVDGAAPQRIEGTEGKRIPLAWPLESLPADCVLSVRLSNAKVYAVATQ